MHVSGAHKPGIVSSCCLWVIGVVGAATSKIASIAQGLFASQESANGRPSQGRDLEAGNIQQLPHLQHLQPKRLPKEFFTQFGGEDGAMLGNGPFTYR